MSGIVSTAKTAVDEYWADHSPRGVPLSLSRSIASVRSYRDYGRGRREFMDLYGSHEGEVLLEYGCGVGDDLIGFITTGAKKVIGIDISEKALLGAQFRLLQLRDSVGFRLLGQKLGATELIRVSDGVPVIPLKDKSVDYIHSDGVLQHTTNPAALLEEFFRVLKDGCYSRVMVYNRDSIYFHFDIAFIKGVASGISLLREGGYPWEPLPVDELFAHLTDGVDCPISRSYRPADFVKICEEAGFETSYLGGYVTHNIENFQIFKGDALEDPKLPEEHKEFIRKTEIKEDLPWYDGKLCGIGGMYKLRKNGS